jgi:uncharacterized membrane protein
MLVYVLSNANQTLGVFSSLLEVQKYYSTLYNGIDPAFNVKLEEFSLNSTTSRDMTIFLKQNQIDENIFKPKLNYYRGKFKKEHDIFEPRFFESIQECDNCGGEDCVRNGECCNDNYDY